LKLGHCTRKYFSVTVLILAVKKMEIKAKGKKFIVNILHDDGKLLSLTETFLSLEKEIIPF
jgi:hypothetical protein